MRRTAFIICEYNPFHNGHKLHIKETKKAGAESIVCIMSGNFVQRGEFAFCDKITRARFAIENGADLVIELPEKYVLSGANFFALGAARIIASLGISGTLSCGASAAGEDILRLADLCADNGVLSEAKELSLKSGITYASALQKTIEKIQPETARIMTDPNSILAVEYLNALREVKADMDFFCLQRNVSHDVKNTFGCYCSAKHLRDLYSAGGNVESMRDYIPQTVYNVLAAETEAGSIPIDRNKVSAAVMARLQYMTAADFRAVEGVNQGLENRIFECIKETSDLFTLYDRIKTKRYPHARIRRILLSAAVGITKDLLSEQTPYIRVLGMNGKGREIIKESRTDSAFPLVMNLSEAPLCKERTLDYLSGKLYDICRAQPMNNNCEYTSKPYVS